MINLIRRNTPALEKSFILETVEKENGHGVYGISARSGKIVLSGDCKISQAMAYYHYLKEFCGVHISHTACSDLASITEAPLPEKEIHQVILQDRRMYMNYTTAGCSTAFWGWDEWEKEIDFMAMNGINMPLFTAGTECVWYYAMRDFKYSENGALGFLSGPAFWPWQTQGKIWGYFPLTDAGYIEKRLELGKKIIERENELGMTPVQTGYSGMIPKSISRLYRNARIQLIDSWFNFPPCYAIDISDPLFRKFGLALLQKQRQLFGAFHYYTCCPPALTKRQKKKKDYLHSFGKAVDRLYREFDSEAVIVLNADKADEQLLKGIEQGRLLVIDEDGEAYKTSNGFLGHNFICGSVINRAGRTAIYGSGIKTAANPYLEAKSKYENCVGTGLFPEGLGDNSLLFELSLDMLTSAGRCDTGLWLESYAKRRYNTDDEKAVNAVKTLFSVCYSEKNAECPGSVLCARPSTELFHTAPGDTLKPAYENTKLLEAAELLAQCESACGDGYEYDMLDLTRQLLSNHEYRLYCEIMEAYRSKNVDAFEKSTNRFLAMAEDIDKLLQTKKELTLSYNLACASSAAITDKEKQNFELNLLCSITIWGPVNRPILYDYSWREWGGLVSTYHAQRWHSFFEQLAVYFTKRKFSTATKKQFFERNDYVGNGFYKNYEKFEKNWLQTVSPDKPSEENTLETAKAILEANKKYLQ